MPTITTTIQIRDDLIAAARDLYDPTSTLAEVKAENPEYLRGQVELIGNLTWRSDNVDSDEVTAEIERLIFAKGQGR